MKLSTLHYQNLITAQSDISISNHSSVIHLVISGSLSSPCLIFRTEIFKMAREGQVSVERGLVAKMRTQFDSPSLEQTNRKEPNTTGFMAKITTKSSNLPLESKVKKDHQVERFLMGKQRKLIICLQTK